MRIVRGVRGARTWGKLVLAGTLAGSVGVLAFAGLQTIAMAASHKKLQSHKKNLTSVTLLYPSINGPEIPMFVAEAAGLWKKYGLNVKLSQISTSVQYTALATGTAQISIGSAAGLEAEAKGATVKVIGVAGPSVSTLIVQSTITSISGLKGKTLVSTSPGSTGTASTKAFLKQHGLAPTTYTVAYTQGSASGLISAMVAKTASAVFLEPPLTFDVYKTDPGSHNLYSVTKTKKVGGVTDSFFAVNGSWAKRNKKAVVDFIKAWRDAIAYAKKNKTVGIEELALGSTVTTSEATKWYDSQLPDLAFSEVTPSIYRINVTVLNLTYSGIKTKSESALVTDSYVKAAGKP